MLFSPPKVIIVWKTCLVAIPEDCYPPLIYVMGTSSTYVA